MGGIIGQKIEYITILYFLQEIPSSHQACIYLIKSNLNIFYELT